MGSAMGSHKGLHLQNYHLISRRKSPCAPSHTSTIKPVAYCSQASQAPTGPAGNPFFSSWPQARSSLWPPFLSQLFHSTPEAPGCPGAWEPDGPGLLAGPESPELVLAVSNASNCASPPPEQCPMASHSLTPAQCGGKHGQLAPAAQAQCRSGGGTPNNPTTGTNYNPTSSIFALQGDQPECIFPMKLFTLSINFGRDLWNLISRSQKFQELPESWQSDVFGTSLYPLHWKML